ncbi:hypothetical protein [Clostridium beijerinckii]|uniref:hypothetical protein n=1 Tax=Clostridium beijerinckii TaxID=1520 RepID=UPI00098CDAF2|nr:hypothetical protein [Clostridium beijerinckii]NRT80041.1 hypothetical protein [Clostridium beijerinckii]OOM48856.1 hypothetical protein CBEIJ_19080 [Clostridium beijerinckii]
MKQNLKDFLFNLIISMLLGVVVGMTQMIVKNINAGIIEELIMFSIIGGVIGTISRFVFIYLIGIKQKSALLAFVCVFIVIGGISCLPSIYYYFVYKKIASIIELISILITAEFLGMSFCYYSYKRNLEFNSKLMSKKNQLLRKN